MARLSVYLPDELLERARALEGGDNTSQLVQRGLQRLLDDEAPAPGYAARPEDASVRILELRDKLTAQARQEYERGYSAALDVAEELPLWILDRLAEANFDVPRWIAPFRAGADQELTQKGMWSSGLTSEEVERALLENVPPENAKPVEISWPWLWELGSVLGELADPLGLDEFCFTPTKARLRGFSDAMRDLWAAIEQPGQRGEGAADSSTPVQEQGKSARGRKARKGDDGGSVGG